MKSKTFLWILGIPVFILGALPMLDLIPNASIAKASGIIPSGSILYQVLLMLFGAIAIYQGFKKKKAMHQPMRYEE